MKQRPMTWGRWMELIFGVIIPGVFIVPSLVFYLIVDSFAIIFVGIGHQTDFVRQLVNYAVLLFIGVISVGSVVILGSLIFMGPGKDISHGRVPRWFVTTIGFLGLVIACFFFIAGLPGWINLFTSAERWTFLRYLGHLNARAWYVFLFEDARFVSLGLVGPIVVGLRYLPQLLKGEPGNS